MSPEELQNKFLLNAEPVLDNLRSQEIVERVMSLEAEESLTSLMDLLSLRK